MGLPLMIPLVLLEVAILVTVVVAWWRAIRWSRDGAPFAPDNHPFSHHAVAAFWSTIAAVLPLITIALRDPKLFAPLLRFFGA